MTTLEFIADMAKTLIWPLFLFAVLLWFRAPLRQMLPNVLKVFLNRHSIDKLKIKDVEIDFNVAVQTVRDAAESAKQTTEIADDPRNEVPGLLHKAMGIAEISPEAAIIFSWIHLQHEINMAAHRMGMQQISRSAPTTAKCRQILFMHGTLTPDQMRLIESMHSVRNEVLHGFDPRVDVRTAEDYAVNMEKLTGVLRNQRNINSRLA